MRRFYCFPYKHITHFLFLYILTNSFHFLSLLLIQNSTIQFWDLDKQKLIYTLSIRENRVIPYAEVIRWTSEDTLVAVSHLKPDASWPEEAESETAVADGEVGSSPESQVTVIKIRFTVDGTLSHKVCTINAMPHTKPIYALTPIMRQNHAMSFVTAGGDKKLVIFFLFTIVCTEFGIFFPTVFNTDILRVVSLEVPRRS